MPEEKVNNQENSEVNTKEEVTTPVESTEPKVDEGATPKTDEEFSDPNMQKDYTQKMQSLSEERKMFETERNTWSKEQETVKQKLDLYDRMDKDPEVVKFVSERYGPKQQPTEITDDELLDAQSDVGKFRELVQREVRKAENDIISPLNHDMNEMKLENELSNYGNMKGNDDFWTLDEANLIEPQLYLARKQNPKMDNFGLIQRAHQEARKLVNSITDKVKKDEKARIDGTIQDKKDGSIDKGGKLTVSKTDSFKGNSLKEIAEKLMKQ